MYILKLDKCQVTSQLTGWSSVVSWSSGTLYNVQYFGMCTCPACVYSHFVVLYFPLAPLALPLPEDQRDQLDQVLLEDQQDHPSHLFLALHERSTVYQ